MTSITPRPESASLSAALSACGWTYDGYHDVVGLASAQAQRLASIHADADALAHFNAVVKVLDRCGWTPEHLQHLTDQSEALNERLAAFWELVRREVARG